MQSEPIPPNREHLLFFTCEQRFLAPAGWPGNVDQNRGITEREGQRQMWRVAKDWGFSDIAESGQRLSPSDQGAGGFRDPTLPRNRGLWLDDSWPKS